MNEQVAVPFYRPTFIWPLFVSPFFTMSVFSQHKFYEAQTNSYYIIVIYLIQNHKKIKQIYYQNTLKLLLAKASPTFAETSFFLRAAQEAAEVLISSIYIRLVLNIALFVNIKTHILLSILFDLLVLPCIGLSVPLCSPFHQRFLASCSSVEFFFLDLFH